MNKWIYYSVSISVFLVCFFILNLAILHLNLPSIIAFAMSFIWHFTLHSPGLRDKMLQSKKHFSFIVLIFKINFYLQMFAPVKGEHWFRPAIRALSPLVFNLVLASINLEAQLWQVALFSLLASAIFELMLVKIPKKDEIFSR